MSRPRRDDGGFTLVELIVSISIFSILGALLVSTVISANKSVTSTRSATDMTEQAHALVNRIARDLREASQIDATYPALSDGHSGVTFEADFNNDGTIQATAADPEVLTYCQKSNNAWLMAGSVNCDAFSAPSTSNAACDGSAAKPCLLDDDITAFTLTYSSSYSANNIGTQTWNQLDSAGDGNGVLDSGEWPKIDVIGISATVSSGGHTASYATSVNLRNR